MDDVIGMGTRLVAAVGMSRTTIVPSRVWWGAAKRTPRSAWREPDLKVIALAYYDTVVTRYGDLEQAVVSGDDQGIVEKIKQARARRDALLGDAAVSARFPK